MAAYNLYRGNGSRAERIDDRRSEKPKQTSAAPRPPQRRPSLPAEPLARLPILGDQSLPAEPLARLPILGDLPKKLGELETEDLLLILILYLMYRESGDKELLIIMGAMYLL